uniref:Uncharacterized protein n=1 Tax=Arundo donax TaxID=35708 RepID=A0A0A9GD23_ARUDO
MAARTSLGRVESKGEGPNRVGGSWREVGFAACVIDLGGQDQDKQRGACRLGGDGDGGGARGTLGKRRQ